MRTVRMNGTQLTTMLSSTLSIFIFVGLFHFLLPEATFSQGETTSAIVGQVSDASGAAVPSATVTVANKETGLRRSASTDGSGRFNFPQLKPGTYSVKVEAEGFEPQQNNAVSAALGQKQTVDFRLKIAQSNQTVEITSEAPILNPENANTSTTLNAHALEDLPNPGGDLTYPLQFAAGALVNTAGSGNDFVGGTNGYGNVEFNGLPALSNGYIVDGLETNDPLTNLNSGLSTNLVLGLNSISEVTVNTLSYAVDQGRYGASQVNYVTKSGSNQFHGNLYELWNGSKFNAANYFTNATPGNHKPRSTLNHFGGSVGGSITHDKLFFFFDSEWVRIALPIVTATTVPTPAFQNYVLQQLLPYLAVRSMLVGGCPQLRMMETVAQIARACLIRAMIMNRSKLFGSITTSMRKTPPGFAFKRTTDSKLPTPIPSILCSTLFPLNPCTRLQQDIRTSFRRIS